MKSYGIYVFSGTGNTLKCADKLQKELAELGLNVPLYRIESGIEKANEPNMILCYPIYGFNAPSNMIRFCSGLPKGDGNVYILKSSGEPLKLNDNSSQKMIKILQKKGYVIRGEWHFVMPYNMIFRHSDALAAKMWQTAQKRIPEVASVIAGEMEVSHSVPLPAKIMSHICRIEYPFYPFNGRLFRVDMKKCIQCMSCVKNCPVQNIHYIDGKFSFGVNCIGCTRCSFSCPTDAFHIGILDFMRTNGKYNFDSDPEKAVIGRYCRKAYKRYFDE